MVMSTSTLPAAPRTSAARATAHHATAHHATPNRGPRSRTTPTRTPPPSTVRARRFPALPAPVAALAVGLVAAAVLLAAFTPLVGDRAATIVTAFVVGIGALLVGAVLMVVWSLFAEAKPFFAGESLNRDTPVLVPEDPEVYHRSVDGGLA